MQAQQLPASRGWIWVIEGLRLIRSAPMAVASAISTAIIMLSMVWIVPLLGQVAFYMLVPMLEIGLFLIFRGVAQGEATPPATLFAGFRMQLRPLFTLGGIRMISDCLIVLIAVHLASLDLVQLNNTMALLGGGSGKGAQAPLVIPESLARAVMATMLWVVVLRLPITLASWFAAPFICLRGVPVLKALFFSWVACWRNLGALIVFFLSYALVALVLPSFALSALGALWPPIFLPAAVISTILSVGILHAGFYRSACDVFGEWPRPWTHEI